MLKLGLRPLNSLSFVSSDVDSKILDEPTGSFQPKKDSAQFTAKISLRPHQRHSVKKTFEAIAEGNKRHMVVLPVGSGKTFVFAHFGLNVSSTVGKKILVLAHRRELLLQAKDTFLHLDDKLRINLDCGQDQAIVEDSDVICASVSTLGRSGGIIDSFKEGDDMKYNFIFDSLTEEEKENVTFLNARLARYNPKDFKVIIIDECHHVASPSYLKILYYFIRHNPNIQIFGCTATPYRTDNKSIFGILGEPVFHMDILDALSQGLLCGFVVESFETNTDLSDIDSQNGDFNEEQLSRKLALDSHRNDIICKVVKNANENQERKKILIFCVNVAHAEQIKSKLNKIGIPTDIIIGSTTATERLKVFSHFNSGKITCIVNCGVLTEGFNMPSIDCVVLARPTMSKSLFTQMIGRGLRLHEGKKDCLFIDIKDRTHVAKNAIEKAPISMDTLKAASEPDSISDLNEDEDETTVGEIDVMNSSKDNSYESYVKKVSGNTNRQRIDIINVFSTEKIEDKSVVSIKMNKKVIPSETEDKRSNHFFKPQLKKLDDELEIAIKDINQSLLKLMPTESTFNVVSGRWNTNLRWRKINDFFNFIALPDGRVYFILKDENNLENNKIEFSQYNNKKDGNIKGKFYLYRYDNGRYEEIEKNLIEFRRNWPIHQPKYFKCREEYIKYNYNRNLAKDEAMKKKISKYKQASMHCIEKNKKTYLYEILKKAELDANNIYWRHFAESHTVKNNNPPTEAQWKALISYLIFMKKPRALNKYNDNINYNNIKLEMIILNQMMTNLYDTRTTILSKIYSILKHEGVYIPTYKPNKDDKQLFLTDEEQQLEQHFGFYRNGSNRISASQILSQFDLTAYPDLRNSIEEFMNFIPALNVAEKMLFYHSAVIPK